MEALQIYQQIKAKINAYQYALYLINWDSETEAPVGSFEERSKQVGKLVEMMLACSHDPQYIEALNQLSSHREELDEDTKRAIIKDKEALDKELKIPTEELVAYEMLLAKSQTLWQQAKLSNDYSKFSGALKDIIDFQRKYIGYLETEETKGYDVLLDDYEKGFTQADYDYFFKVLKEELVPFVKSITAKPQIKDDFIKKSYSIEKQKAYARYLMNVMAFDPQYGITKESEHPFTSGYGTTDVRVTCHYYEQLLTSSIFSMIHELGHATYERQCNPKYDVTALAVLKKN